MRTWRDRLGWPFIGSTLFAVVAWTTIAVQVLPRLGYPAGVQAQNAWTCGQPK